LDWKFVEFPDVSPGPWSRFGENNTFVIESRKKQTRLAQGPKSTRAARDGDEPVVVTK
jgi:hypothetical protein